MEFSRRIFKGEGIGPSTVDGGDDVEDDWGGGARYAALPFWKTDSARLVG